MMSLLVGTSIHTRRSGMHLQAEQWQFLKTDMPSVIQDGHGI